MKNSFRRFRRLIGSKVFARAVDRTVNKLVTFLQPDDKILDLGAGACQLAKKLSGLGYPIQPVDVANRSYYPEIKVRVYDGVHLPFKNNRFDAALLISVLHHTNDPELVLREAVRVSKKLIIHENIITNYFQKNYTFLIHCLLNHELIEPHTNKTDEEWRSLFRQLNLKIVKVIDEKAWIWLQNKFYFLEKL